MLMDFFLIPNGRKAMALEMERQRLARRSKEVEAALADALWSGQTTVAAVERKTTPMLILHTDEAALEPLNFSTSYGNLVRNDVMDFTERPKTVSAVPHYLLYSDQAMAPLTAVANRDYEAFGETGGVKTNAVGRGTGKLSLRKTITSPISRVKTLPTLPGIRRQQDVDDRSAAGRSRGAYRNRSDNTTITSNSSWQQLDPVLYQERARTSWGREKKLGKVRTRHDPPGYKRALLTSKGHPGIFNMDPLDEEDAMSRQLGRTV